MSRNIDCWLNLNGKSSWNKSLVREKELLLNVNSDTVLVVQYYNFSHKKRWVSVHGFVVEENPSKNYGLSRVYTKEEKQKIEELINSKSLEGKVNFDEGGTRII